eukprot:TRINITY_DN6063_c0_g1_i3.p1 TRINITY_DN6063_c0_g1~~TRINITY_DN6063_c0_g1_i3.p1  ORF type:complete len:221 (+),score=57.30 TRINITY_DN6063_c0_g1_i3:211-873(+)
MPKRSGPTVGSASRPMVSSAGADHVIFSKKLLLSISVVLAMTAFLFFTIEQSRIAGNMRKSRVALKQTNSIQEANLKLESSKAELEDEEAELVNLYSKWLDEDSSELELSQEQLASLKQQLKDVTEKIKQNSETLSGKDLTLEEKEKRLSAYQFKIQQKQNFIDEMAAMIEKQTGQAPKGTGIDETVDDLVWNDELEGDDASYEEEAYEGDDDWLNDEEW